MKIRKIKTDDITIRLSEPIDVEVSITYDALGIAGMGKNLNDAIKDFGESFLTKFIGYVADSDENLTDDAIEIKNKLRALIPNWKEALKNVSKGEKE